MTVGMTVNGVYTSTAYKRNVCIPLGTSRVVLQSIRPQTAQVEASCGSCIFPYEQKLMEANGKFEFVERFSFIFK